ncbi:MAG TPA: MmcQ/YjbR family DNA-binding protein [Gammaproteobacteria bacterium]|nr:MmcQ/YjbR family DNA-binding protein [Gammaproteobacteria bacterium]
MDAVVSRFRKLCLAFPEASEAGSFGHPNFRAGQKTFTAFEWINGRPSLAFRAEASVVDGLLQGDGFFATPYGRGRWISLWADERLNWRFIEQLAEQAYRTVATKRMLAALDRKHGGGRVDGNTGIRHETENHAHHPRRR